MAQGQLTKSIVERIQPNPDRDVWRWDGKLPGFGVRVKPSGVRIYLIQYRDSSRRTRRLKLGQHGTVTCDAARKRARIELGRVAEGANPAAERKTASELGTVADLAKRYLEQHALPKKKASSVRADEVNLRRHVLPRLGRLRVDAVQRADVQAMHHAMRKTPGAANRTIALLSKMMRLAEKWGLRADGSNPCRHVERYRENRRERYLSEAELARLGAVLTEAERQRHSGEPASTETPEMVAAIRLLIFTGCRRSEILGLRWDHVDVEARCLRFPDSKTGAKTVPLNAPARDVLGRLERGSEWVIPGRGKIAALVNIEKPWRRIRARAGLSDVRLHDLRHSFASVGAAGGHSLIVLGALLGHTQQATTQRYAHLADDPLRQASEAIGSRIAAALDRRPIAEVIPIAAARR